MNGTTDIGGMGLPNLAALNASPPVLAQAASDSGFAPLDWVLDFFNSSSDLARTVINLASAIAILFIGFVIATIFAAIVRSILKRTNLDNRIAQAVLGQQSDKPIPIETWVAQAIYYIILIFTIVAFLDALELEAVSKPLRSFLDTIFSYLPSIGAAALWLAGGWLLAYLAKTLIVRGLQVFRLDDWLNAQAGAEDGSQPFLVNETLGNALYWFILLFSLYFALASLGLQDQLTPIENMLSEVLAALPRILKALLIGAVGWIVARIARSIVTNFLSNMGIDRLGASIGLSEEGDRALSKMLGTLLYSFILVVTAINVLNELQIDAISGPAIGMLNQVLEALPRVFGAAAIVAIAYFAGKLVSNLVTALLTNFGFDRIFSVLGFEEISPTGETSLDKDPEAAPQRTPSEMVGIVVLVVIVLFSVVAAIDFLQFQQLSNILTNITAIVLQVVAGIAVFAVGLYLANLAFRLIASSGGPQVRLVGQTARVVIITFVSAMALQVVGIAPDIVNLAFGLILGALGVAFAIAFGLGGRDVASEQIRQWLDSFRNTQ